MRKIPVLAWISVLAILVPSATWAQAPAEPSEDVATAAAERHADPGAYVVGPEDVLRIVTWQEPDFSLTTKVRPDGRITLPLINDVEVAGHTPAEVRELITDKMKDFVRDPRVTVIVEEIKSFRVYFLGEINTQGPIQLYRPTRLLQAIATAGGLTEFSAKKITILRNTGGIERRIEVDYKKLLNGEPGQENLFLEPGDTILVK